MTSRRQGELRGVEENNLILPKLDPTKCGINYWNGIWFEPSNIMYIHFYLKTPVVIFGGRRIPGATLSVVLRGRWLSSFDFTIWSHRLHDANISGLSKEKYRGPAQVEKGGPHRNISPEPKNQSFDSRLRGEIMIHPEFPESPEHFDVLYIGGATAGIHEFKESLWATELENTTLCQVPFLSRFSTAEQDSILQGLYIPVTHDNLQYLALLGWPRKEARVLARGSRHAKTARLRRRIRCKMMQSPLAVGKEPDPAENWNPLPEHERSQHLQVLTNNTCRIAKWLKIDWSWIVHQIERERELRIVQRHCYFWALLLKTPERSCSPQVFSKADQFDNRFDPKTTSDISCWLQGANPTELGRSDTRCNADVAPMAYGLFLFSLLRRN